METPPSPSGGEPSVPGFNWAARSAHFLSHASASSWRSACRNPLLSVMGKAEKAGPLNGDRATQKREPFFPVLRLFQTVSQKAPREIKTRSFAGQPILIGTLRMYFFPSMTFSPWLPDFFFDSLCQNKAPSNTFCMLQKIKMKYIITCNTMNVS